MEVAFDCNLEKGRDPKDSFDVEKFYLVFFHQTEGIVYRVGRENSYSPFLWYQNREFFATVCYSTVDAKRLPVNEELIMISYLNRGILLDFWIMVAIC